MERSYIILAYKLPDQAARLIRSLSDGDQTFFYIHVDRNFDMEPFVKACAGLSNVKFLTGDDRVHSYWGDYGTVNATLNAMRMIVKDRRRGFIILLSGQDYPIRSNREIDHFLETHADHDFAVHFPLPSTTRWAQTNGGKNRLEYYHVSLHRPGREIQYVDIRPWCFTAANLKQCLYLLRFRPDQIWRLPQFLFRRRRIPDCLKYYGSETWWVMRTSSAAAILDFLDRNPALISFFKYVSVPEEIMFASLLKSLPACRDQLIDSSLRLICWNDARSSSPQSFTMQDQALIGKARTQEEMLFARKFDSSGDEAILDWLDAVLDQSDSKQRNREST